MNFFNERDVKDKYYNNELLLTIDNLAELYILSYVFHNSTIIRDNSYIFNIPHDYLNGICKFLYNTDNKFNKNTNIIKYSNIIDLNEFYNHNNKWLSDFKNNIELYFIKNKDNMNIYNNRQNDYIIKLNKLFFGEKIKKYEMYDDLINNAKDLADASIYFSEKEDISKIKKHIFR